MKLVQINSEQIRMHDVIQGCIAKNEVDEYHFYRKYFGFAISVANRYSNSRSQSKEIVNESFFKIFKNLNKYNFSQEIEPWIAKIVANTSIDMLRKNKRHFRLAMQIDNDIADPTVIEFELDDDDISSIETLLPILQILSPKYKLVFNLFVFEEYTHKEIAIKLKISENTSKSNYFRAKNILKLALINERSQKLKEIQNG